MNTNSNTLYLLPSKEIEYSSYLFQKMSLNTKYIQKPKTPIEKYVEFGRNCPSEGWFFPCIKCCAITSHECQYDNTKASLCHHCKIHLKKHLSEYHNPITVDEFCIRQIRTNLSRNFSKKNIYRKIIEY